jgi:hypothetical protein
MINPLSLKNPDLPGKILLRLPPPLQDSMPPPRSKQGAAQIFSVIFKITLYNHVPWTYNEKLYKAYNNGRKTANPSGLCRFLSKSTGFSADFAEKRVL